MGHWVWETTNVWEGWFLGGWMNSCWVGGWVGGKSKKRNNFCLLCSKDNFLKNIVVFCINSNNIVFLINFFLVVWQTDNFSSSMSISVSGLVPVSVSVKSKTKLLVLSFYRWSKGVGQELKQLKGSQASRSVGRASENSHQGMPWRPGRRTRENARAFIAQAKATGRAAKNPHAIACVAISTESWEN